MVDSIRNSNLPATQRSQSLVSTRARSLDVLNAVAEQRASTAPVRVFSVQQASKSSPTNAKLPRGSIVDVLV